MSPENEPTPAQGQREVEQKVHDDINSQYESFLKQEQEALENRLKGEAAQKHGELKTLGFVTLQDVEAREKAIFGKFFNELQAIKEENKKLKEFVMRAKMQGLNSGATDEKPIPKTSPMDKYKPAFR